MEHALAKDISLQGCRNFVLPEHSLALGTAIHGTPLLTVLRSVLPDARIVSLASGFGAGVLQGNPHLEQLVTTPSPLKDLRGAVNAWRAARPFAGEPYVVLHSTGNMRTKVMFAAALSGGHTRVGFNVRPELVTRSLEIDGRLSQIDNNLRLLDTLGYGERMREVLASRPELAEPAVFPTPTDQSSVREHLQAAGLRLAAPLVVMVTQTSPTQRKSWRPERFRQVAERLHRETGAEIVFGGTAGEATAVETLRTGFDAPSANLAGKTTLLQLAALFGMADLGVVLDTGPMHLGRAMRTPMVIIAPAWSPPVEWLPVGNPRVRILKNLDLPDAPADYIIDEVSADEVEAAALELLAAYPPRQRAR